MHKNVPASRLVPFSCEHLVAQMFLSTQQDKDATQHLIAADKQSCLPFVSLQLCVSLFFFQPPELQRLQTFCSEIDQQRQAELKQSNTLTGYSRPSLGRFRNTDAAADASDEWLINGTAMFFFSPFIFFF